MIELHRKAWRVRTKFRGWPSVIVTTGPKATDRTLAGAYDAMFADLHAAGRRDVFDALQARTADAWQVLDGVQRFGAEAYRLPATDRHEQVPGDIPLGELFDGWCEWLERPTTVSKRGKRAYSPATIQRWEQSWNAIFSGLPAGRDTAASALTTDSLARILDARIRQGLTNSGANRDAMAVSALYTWATEVRRIRGLLRPQWRKLAEPVPDDEAGVHIEREQLEDAISAAPDHWSHLWGDFWRLLAETGLRIGELQHLQARDITDRFIKVEERPEYRLKTQSSVRRVPVTSTSAAILTRLRGGCGPTDYVVPEEMRKYSAARYRWEVMMIAAGLVDEDARAQGTERHRYTIHSLRHLFGVTAARAGFSMLEIMRLMGHANEATTRRYASFHPDAEDLGRFARGLAIVFAARLRGPGAAPAPHAVSRSADAESTSVNPAMAAVTEADTGEPLAV